MTVGQQDALVDMLACFRLTRLAVEDDFPPTKWARDIIVDIGGVDSPWAELVTCPWCISFWIALAVLAARRATPRLWRLLAVPLALSATSGLLSRLAG